MERTTVNRPRINRDVYRVDLPPSLSEEQSKGRLRVATRTITPKTNIQVSKELPNCKNCNFELKIENAQTYLCSNCGRKYSRKVQATACKFSPLPNVSRPLSSHSNNLFKDRQSESQALSSHRINLSKSSSSLSSVSKKKLVSKDEVTVNEVGDFKGASLSCPKCKSSLEQYSHSLVFCSSCNKSFSKKNK